MRIPQMIAAELRRLTATPMARLALIALMLVPILYGGLYLWANQDPYAKLVDVPVALVVADAGTTTDSGYTNSGDDVADQLLDDASFDWHRVSAQTAAAGVNDGTYDFSVTLPADFSAALASSSGDAPYQATVVLTTNDANSYLASTIGEQAAKTIKASIVQKVNDEAASQFLLGLATIRGDLVTATDGGTRLVDGATQLAAGASSAQSGATSLTSGLDQLVTGAGTATDGSSGLVSGLGQLSTGADTLASGLADGAAQTAGLPAQTAQLAAGAQSVSDGNAALATQADALGAAAQQAADSVDTVRADLRARLGETGLDAAAIDEIMATLDPLGDDAAAANDAAQQTVAGIDALAAGSAQVASGAAQLSAATPDLASKLAEAASGSATLASGIDSAEMGAGTLNTGLSTLRDGLVTADAGSASLRDGLSTLSDGLTTLTTGATSLRDGLSDGVTSIPDESAQQQDAQAAGIADPVSIDQSEVTSAGTYGAGLAPFFASLAAWIGIYALFLIVKPVSRRAITALHSPIKITLAGWLTPGLLGALQMAGLFAILSLALGFTIDAPLGVYAMMTLASLTFAAIILALNVWLGSVGQFLGLVLMVVQLVTAGGTFPWQTLPAPLAALHHILPMGFTTDALRQLMYGGNQASTWADAGVLACWLLGALLLAGIGVTRMTHFRTLRDLQPSLIG
ncbi:YhgE/Pip domain-containing protein [Microbacteriaceae bacterium VKM Ac-2855]|nr:YhgE/Pip domain-containing protein [Microbacteriaceae bacterium VKM Ac-2855]